MQQDDDFLLEQLRRRTARRSTPVAPHPELTPQQRQHIIERSNSTGSMAATNATGTASTANAIAATAPVLNYRDVSKHCTSGARPAEGVEAWVAQSNKATQATAAGVKS